MKMNDKWNPGYQGLLWGLIVSLWGCGSSESSPENNNRRSNASLSVSFEATSSSSSPLGDGGDPSLVLALNVGAFAKASYEGVTYQPDRFAEEGAPNSTIGSIGGTEEDALFQTERYGSYTYEIPVTKALYDVQLHFVEMYWEASGERSFSVIVENELALSEIDLFSEAGHDQAYSYTVEDIQVSDGHLTIELEAVVDNGTLSGIAVYSEGGAFLPPLQEEPEPKVPGEPGVASAENSGADCPVPTLPDASKLPTITTLPDPFMGLDGERIASKDDWRCHRQNLNWQLQAYEAGIKPYKPETVSGSVGNDAIEVTVGHGGEKITFSASVTLPSAGEAPYPAMIGIGASNLDNGYLARQGIAVINVNNNELGAQSGGGSRGTGLFYDLYGREHSASSMTAWAWGVSRLIDVLETPEAELIDATRLGVTGCSRNGKGALLAGALDQRIALTIPQESGAGGAMAWRVAQEMADSGTNIQTLSHAAGEQPWFRESFGADFGGPNTVTLPFDHHQLMGMVAPRGLLVLDNNIDWLGPRAAYIGTAAAKEIYRALGAPENIAYSENGGHGHCQFPAHQQDILAAFVKRFLLGELGSTEVMRSTQADEEDVGDWVDWSTPTLD
ncbi:malectin [Marinimicrobium agarilyticum]|uniref:malectin n=1 Tax=Marinimicrobium agarilyticum TaxID=306546 RepID=UPI000688C457|nr:malectin [Marinimicrobium agarilyticum]